MDDALKNQVRSAISPLGSIRCVYFSGDKNFFLLLKPYIYKERSARHGRDDSERPYIMGYVPEHIDYFTDCSIIYKNRLLLGQEAEEFLQKHIEEAGASPNFTIKEILESGKEDKDVIVQSKKYLTPCKRSS